MLFDQVSVRKTSEIPIAIEQRSDFVQGFLPVFKSTVPLLQSRQEKKVELLYTNFPAMNFYHPHMKIVFVLCIAFSAIVWLMFPVSLPAQGHQDNGIIVKIHLRGVSESKISLLALTNSRLYKPIAEVTGVRNGETIILRVAPDYLPGEFVLRFDYQEKETDAPYPSEKYLFIGNQDLELWVRPVYCNNPDSTWFQPEEKENRAFALFTHENSQKRKNLELLQDFLLRYEDTGSFFYREGVEEFERSRQIYNQWLRDRIETDREFFVGSLYAFQYLPPVPREGTEQERIRTLIDRYFDGMDFTDPRMIRTSFLKKWMDAYVNLYGQFATTIDLRDSLFSEAGRTAIEQAKKGDPLLYGWMVDYFYTGYETNGIDAGMLILEPYLNDPECLTSRRLEIHKRLQGIETLVPGTSAPNFVIPDSQGELFELTSMKTPARFILLLFWSTGCSHCAGLAAELYPWHQQPQIINQVEVVAVSLDETETETELWRQTILEFPGWVHLHDPAGVNGEAASAYYLVSTPVLFLLDAGTKTIVGLPQSLEELKRVIANSWQEVQNEK